jgi:hypothetical protein
MHLSERNKTEPVCLSVSDRTRAKSSVKHVSAVSCVSLMSLSEYFWPSSVVRKTKASYVVRQVSKALNYLHSPPLLLIITYAPQFIIKTTQILGLKKETKFVQPLIGYTAFHYANGFHHSSFKTFSSLLALEEDIIILKNVKIIKKVLKTFLIFQNYTNLKAWNWLPFLYIKCTEAETLNYLFLLRFFTV